MRTTAAPALAVALTLAACAEPPPSPLGDPKAGVALIGQAQCGACHVIPGIAAADGMSGPPLDGFSRRMMIAGVLANTPANLVVWLRTPQSVSPGNAMPDMNLSEPQARDIAAYLEIPVMRRATWFIGGFLAATTLACLGGLLVVYGGLFDARAATRTIHSPPGRRTRP